MSNRRFLLLAVALSFGPGVSGVFAAEPPALSPALIGFDLADLDAHGLVGPPDGKRALDYEFCIPAGDRFTAEVGAIDPSARFHAQSRGRIGCTAEQVLVLGNTHQWDFDWILQSLAELPYVERIERAWFE